MIYKLTSKSITSNSQHRRNFSLKRIYHIIVSPCSRCTPLTLPFARHQNLNTKTISDERSAAFIALRLAQTLNEPIVLLCTSGTAALNVAPSIT